MSITPAMDYSRLQWIESRSAVYPQCRYVAQDGNLEFRLAHFTPSDIWRLTTRTIVTSESPYSGWLRDEWFATKEHAQAAAERHAALQ